MSDHRPSALVIGATSDIGRSIAQALAGEGYALHLAARDADRLARDAKDLEIRYETPVTRHVFDVLDPQSYAALLDQVADVADIAVCVVGLLGDQAENERDPDAAERVMMTNYLGPARLLSGIANRFEARGSGTLVGVSSVAGERGRASNYVYGSAKSGFSAYLSGLRNRLAAKGVRVVTVKPGFVHTRMTEGMDLPPLLTAEPEAVGKAVLCAIRKRRDVVFVKSIWRYVMLAIRLVPEPIFKRMRI